MATLTTQTIARAGTDPSYVAAGAGGDKVRPPARYLEVVNGGGGSITVTVDSQRNCDQGFDHNLSVAVPAGERRKIDLEPNARFTDPADGLIAVTYSGVSSVTVGAFR